MISALWWDCRYSLWVSGSKKETFCMFYCHLLVTDQTLCLLPQVEDFVEPNGKISLQREETPSNRYAQNSFRILSSQKKRPGEMCFIKQSWLLFFFSVVCQWGVGRFEFCQLVDTEWSRAVRTQRTIHREPGSQAGCHPLHKGEVIIYDV